MSHRPGRRYLPRASIARVFRSASLGVNLDNAVADETTSLCRPGPATVPSMTVTPRKTNGLSSAETDVMRAVSNDISSHIGLLYYQSLTPREHNSCAGA